MAKNTYVATAPDGSHHTRKTDRTYSHAVLLEGKDGWGVAGFCGRLDLAQKKQTEHPGSIVVDCGVLGADQTDMPEAKVAENAQDGPPQQPKPTIGSLVRELLMDEKLGYEEIVETVHGQFPDANTSVRSVASVAAVMRKKGSPVPMRRKSKA